MKLPIGSFSASAYSICQMCMHFLPVSNGICTMDGDCTAGKNEYYDCIDFAKHSGKLRLFDKDLK